MKKMNIINLTMFDGGEGSGAGSAGAAGQSGAGAEGQAAAGMDGAVKGRVEYGVGEASGPETAMQSTSAAGNDGETPDLKAEFESLINGKFKDQYNQNVQKIVKSRLRGQSKMQERLQSQQAVLDLLGARYGVDPTDAEAITNAINEDNDYWEAAAEKENMSVEAYRKMKTMEAQLNYMKEMKAQEESMRQQNELIARWGDEERALQQIYPEFNLNQELLNPQFASALKAGVFTMQQIYETVHHDELMRNAMGYTAQTVAKKQADAVRAGLARPTEGGITSREAVTRKTDPSKWTAEDLEEVRRRVERGELIRL